MTELPVLDPYQVEGAEWLADRTAAYLADPPGLGKTAQAIRAANIIGARKIGVIGPAIARYNWFAEFRKFSREPVDLFYQSYGVLSRRDQRGLSALFDFDVLIFDEAHFLKEPTASRTQQALARDGWAGGARRRWFLSGTPMLNHAGEMWPTLYTQFARCISVDGKPLNYAEFTARYCVFRRGYKGKAKIVGSKNLEELKTRIAPIYLRRPWQKGAMPELRVSTYDLTADTAVKRLKEQEPEDAQLLLRYMELSKVPDAALARYRRLAGLAKIAPTVDMAVEHIKNGQGKLVLFAWHRDVIDGLVKGINDRLGAGAARGVNGAVSARQAAQTVADFQEGDLQVFVGQIVSAGTAITLTTASDVWLVEASWTPAENEQAIKRVWRRGQQSLCVARFLVLPGTLDGAQMTRLARKTEDILQIFG